MNEEEYSEFEQATNIPVMKAYGIWWLKVRSHFLRPLSINVQRKLNQAYRYGLEAYTFSDCAKFIEDVYPVFLSFHQRTGYNYPVSRVDRNQFITWSRALFSSSKTVVLGAYYKGHLLSVDISCLVGDTLILKESITSETGLKMKAPDFLLDRVRSLVKEQTDISTINCGYFSRFEGINRFKIERGAKVIALPAFLNINTALLWAIKHLNRSVYERIVGIKQEHLKGRLKSI